MSDPVWVFSLLLPKEIAALPPEEQAQFLEVFRVRFRDAIEREVALHSAQWAKELLAGTPNKSGAPPRGILS